MISDGSVALTLPNWLDLAVFVAMVAAASFGWRRGAIVGLLDFAGVMAGAGLGATIGGTALTHLAPGSVRLLFVLVLLIGLVAVGATVGHRVGRAARTAVSGSAARRADAVGGIVAHVVAVPLVVWLFAAPLGSVATVRDSTIVRAVDDVAPFWLTGLSAALTTPIVDAGLARPLPPPDPSILDGPAPAELRRSVFRISDLAPTCGLRQSGSGFVIAPERVLTNAHVVAGSTKVSIDATAGPLTATVVQFDPTMDIAVLAVPGLTAPTVTVAPEPAEPGADAIALGYPKGGPYTAAATRVHSTAIRRVRDIYRTGLGERRIYTVDGSIQHGNSGGPLIDTRGRVLGIIFGVDENDDNVGFATNLPEVLDRLNDGLRSDRPVDTGPCAA
ncbi:MarP family serine protease [Nocardia sp. NBC_00881]|uniref:MarP family serine protease n=1 Tax=Nocardia sp. NBC_00881 TaxID=2975995 RepID=UPI0038647EB4|nr:MarP family serine protease [Nocardia sp. NBC_00881]